MLLFPATKKKGKKGGRGYTQTVKQVYCPTSMGASHQQIEGSKKKEKHKIVLIFCQFFYGWLLLIYNLRKFSNDVGG